MREREPAGRARPAPTASAPASPTSPAAAPPIQEYRVQPGDTLLGIALNYGLELAQLQALNPGLEPQSLQVDQRILIPLENAAPRRESLRLELLPPHCWPLPTGRLLCLGQVINREQRAVADVQLQLRAGAVAGQGSAALRLLPPDVAVPYSVILPGHVEGPLQATLHSGHLSDAQPLALELRGEQASQAGGRYRVAATVVNASAETGARLRLALAVMDATGRLRALRVREIPSGLAPAEQLDVVIEAQVEGTGLRHVLLVEALPAR